MPEPLLLAAVFAKLALYVGVLGASGTVICVSIFSLTRTTAVTLNFACLGLVALLLSFALKGSALTGDVAGLTDPEMLSLLWTTQSGTTLAWQLSGLILIILGLTMGKIGRLVSLAGALIALAGFATLGHVADRDSLRLIVVLIVHLICAAMWIGIFIPLGRKVSDDTKLREAAVLGTKFGRAASFAVPLLLVAGAIMAYVLTGSFDTVFGTSYGQALLFKVFLVVFLLMLAVLNKRYLVPRLEEGDSRSARRLLGSVWAESFIVLSILAVTAVLTTSLSLPQ